MGRAAHARNARSAMRLRLLAVAPPVMASVMAGGLLVPKTCDDGVASSQVNSLGDVKCLGGRKDLCLRLKDLHLRQTFRFHSGFIQVPKRSAGGSGSDDEALKELLSDPDLHKGPFIFRSESGYVGKPHLFQECFGNICPGTSLNGCLLGSASSSASLFQRPSHVHRAFHSILNPPESLEIELRVILICNSFSDVGV